MMWLWCAFLALVVVGEARLAEEQLNMQRNPTIPAKNHLIQEPTPSPSHTAACFHADRSRCPINESCHRIERTALLCCDVNSTQVKEGLHPDLTRNQDIDSLHVINATLDELDMSQASWRRLTSISFTDGNIKQIVGEFKKHASAACLNISNNGIINITSPRTLAFLFNLTTLDISRNKLADMPQLNKNIDISLDMRGNNEMPCKSVWDALSKYKGHLNFINSNTTFCLGNTPFTYENSSSTLVPFSQVELIHELKNDCSDVGLGGVNCSCDPVRLDLVEGELPRYSVRVDCSNKNLKSLPPRLPPNTITLNVSYNSITSLAPLYEHPSYEHVRYLIADHNNIQSIVELEGTKFIDNFLLLSLKNNKLKSLPTYILSDTFDRNWNARSVYLGYNKFHCDCTTAKVLKLWLLSKTQRIPDYDQLLCEYGVNKVVELSENKICQQPRDWTDYIYYVIGAEIILLFGLVTKVIYDYWVFKTAGYLPWPASRMPKLPCDWLCE